MNFQLVISFTSHFIYGFNITVMMEVAKLQTKQWYSKDFPKQNYPQ